MYGRITTVNIVCAVPQPSRSASPNDFVDTCSWVCIILNNTICSPHRQLDQHEYQHKRSGRTRASGCTWSPQIHHLSREESSFSIIRIFISTSNSSFFKGRIPIFYDQNLHILLNLRYYYLKTYITLCVISGCSSPNPFKYKIHNF